MQVRDHGSLPLDTQCGGKKVRVVQSNIVHVDVVEVGVRPHAPTTTKRLPALFDCDAFVVDQHLSNSISTASSRAEMEHRMPVCLHLAHSQEGDRGLRLGMSSSISHKVLVHLYMDDDSLSLHQLAVWY